MQRISRRTWIERTAATIASTHLLAGKSDANVNVSRTRRFTMNLSCGSVGVGVDQRGAINLASKYGLEAYSADPGFLAKLTDDENSALLEEMKNRDLVWG